MTIDLSAFNQEDPYQETGSTISFGPVYDTCVKADLMAQDGLYTEALLLLQETSQGLKTPEDDYDISLIMGVVEEIKGHWEREHEKDSFKNTGVTSFDIDT